MIIPLCLVFMSCEEDPQPDLDEKQTVTPHFLLDRKTAVFTNDQNVVSLTFEYTYEYLENNLIDKISESVYFPIDDKLLENTTLHHYDELDVLARTELINDSDEPFITHYIWDEFDRISEKQWVNPEGLWRERYTVMDSSYFSYQKFYDTNDDEATGMQFERDLENHTIVATPISEEGMTRKVIYEYDDKASPYSLSNLSYLWQEEPDVFGLNLGNPLRVRIQSYDEASSKWEDLLVTENKYEYNEFGLPIRQEKKGYVPENNQLLIDLVTVYEYIEVP